MNQQLQIIIQTLKILLPEFYYPDINTYCLKCYKPNKTNLFSENCNKVLFSIKDCNACDLPFNKSTQNQYYKNLLHIIKNFTIIVKYFIGLKTKQLKLYMKHII